jgi:hypothetical protein
MKILIITFAVLASLAISYAKMIEEVRQNILIMDERDRIVGSYEHVFQRDNQLRATPPPMPGISIK